MRKEVRKTQSPEEGSEEQPWDGHTVVASHRSRCTRHIHMANTTRSTPRALPRAAVVNERIAASNDYALDVDEDEACVGKERRSRMGQDVNRPPNIRVHSNVRPVAKESE